MEQGLTAAPVAPVLNSVPMPRRSRHDVLLVRTIWASFAAFGLATVQGACGGVPQRLPVDAAEDWPPPTGNGGATGSEAEVPPASDTPSSVDGGLVPEALPASDGGVEDGPAADAMLPLAEASSVGGTPASPGSRQ